MVLIRINSIVKIKESACSFVKNDLRHYNTIIFLGEIPNMPGHCVLACFNGKHKATIEFGYHIGDFEELSQEET